MALLQNNTQVIFSVNVALTFDDGTTKKDTIEVGDYLLLKFNYDGNKLSRACRVVDITPIVLNTQPESYAASLVVDCSDKFSGQRLKVACKNILNFRIVNKDYVDSLAPDYVVTDEMLNEDALEPVPEDTEDIPGVGIAGVGEAMLIR